MKKIETKYVIIGEVKLPFRFSFNAFIYYNEIFGKEITSIKSLSDIRDMCFCAYKAGCDYNKIEATISIEDFGVLLEDYPESIKALSEAMTEQMGSKKK